MTNTKLIIAVVFAGLLGLFIICFALWCVGCYMHRHCLDLNQYFHAWTVNPTQPTSVVCVERHCSRAERSMRGRRPERLQIERDHEYRDCEQGRIRDGNMDTKPMMQPSTSVQAHHESRGQPYRPSLKRKDRVQNMQPKIQQPTPMHWQAQGALHTSPFVMRPEMAQQPSRQMATRIAKPVQGLPRYQTQELLPYRRPHEESVDSEASGAHQQKRVPMKNKSPVEHASRARRVDYIHICDEYPPIVLEALKKAAPALPTASSASSLSSSNGSGTTQEIPRNDFACTMPDYVTNSPVRFPQHCHAARDLSRLCPGQ